MDSGIIGHKKQLELLQKALAKGKLAHAYVFTGPEGVGKRTVAEKIAFEMLKQGEGMRGEGEGFHPDLMVLQRLDDRSQITIDQIRDLTYKLSLKPYQAENKVAIIDNAHEMNDEAANALLKSLEEPKDYTYIFLITENANRLPKTIISRCQKITFGPLTESQRSKIESEPGDDALELSGKAEEYFGIFSSDKLDEKLVMAYEVADLETWEIMKVLESWIMKLETLLLQNPDKKLALKASMTASVRRLVDQNVNPKLLLTNLMLNT